MAHSKLGLRVAMAVDAVIRITTSDKYMDRVNMYASFYVGIRQGGVSIADMENDVDRDLKKSPNSPNCVLNASNALEPVQHPVS